MGKGVCASMSGVSINWSALHVEQLGGNNDGDDGVRGRGRTSRARAKDWVVTHQESTGTKVRVSNAAKSATSGRNVPTGFANRDTRQTTWSLRPLMQEERRRSMSEVLGSSAVLASARADPRPSPERAEIP